MKEEVSHEVRNVTLSSHVPNSPAPSHHSQQIKPHELVNKGKEQKVDIKDIIAKMSGMSRDEVLLPKEKEEFFEKKPEHQSKQDDREKGTSIYLYSGCSLQKQISKEYRTSLRVV